MTDRSPSDLTTFIGPRKHHHDQATNQELLDIERIVKSRMEEMIKILDSKVKEKKRCYVNQVTIKLPKSEIMKMPHRNKTEYIEHQFLITSNTTFSQLFSNACGFWGLIESDYAFFEERYSHIMGLNEAFTVSEFFETLRVRHVVLYLLRPNKSLNEFAEENKNIRL
jgi:hypothetical protein